MALITENAGLPRRPLRVAFAYDACVPFTVGGAESHYRGVTEELAARGHRVHYLTCRFWPGSDSLDRAQVTLVGVSPPDGLEKGNRSVRASLRYAAGLALYLFRNGSSHDVVEVSAIPPTSVLAAWLGLLRHRKTLLVADWHEVWRRETWIEEFGVAGNFGWIAELVARRCGRNVTFSELHRSRLPGRPEKVPEFVSIESPESSGQAASRHPRLLLSVGRLVPNKRFDLVPGTLACLIGAEPHATRSDWRVVIVGSGPGRKRIEEAALELGVSDRIEFRSRIPSAELSGLLSHAAVLLHPSRREGFGIVVLEASAHGLPAVLCPSADNAATELISAGENGEVAESCSARGLADAIRRVLGRENPSGRTREWWSENGSTYTPTSAADVLEQLWRSD